MKKTIITIALAAMLAGCSTNRNTEPLPERTNYDIASWNAFCAATGHDTADSSAETLNEYLDTWCGSAPEEAALSRYTATQP